MAILFESEGVRRDIAPCRKAGLLASGDAATGTNNAGVGCWWDGGQVSQTLDAVLHKGQTMPEKNRFPAVLQPIAFDSRQDPVSSNHTFGSLGSSSPQAQAVATDMSVRRLTPRECERLQGFPDDYTLIPTNRRTWHRDLDVMREYFQRSGQTYTDHEIERLAADGPRYKALGNSMPVPVMRWIGERINKAIGEHDHE